jgi:signal transduction histidine kinase
MIDSTIPTKTLSAVERTDLEEVINQAQALFFFRDLTLGVFHQVANYLATIHSDLLMLEMLVETNRGDEIIDHINKTKNNVRSVMALISRVQRRGGTLTPVIQKCSIVTEVIRPAIALIKRKIEGKNIHLLYSLTNRDFLCLVDVELAKDILINILNNAIWAVQQNKHTTKKEIFVIVREEPNKKLIRIDIKDSGIGIEPAIFPNLFRPFFTTRQAEGGNGLGLFFSRVLAEQFGGNLNISRSRPGKGTTVALRLPFTESYTKTWA